MKRDLIKTMSFATLHIAVGFTVVYALTGSVLIAGGAALIEPMANTVVFFFHERFWRRMEAHQTATPELSTDSAGKFSLQGLLHGDNPRHTFC